MFNWSHPDIRQTYWTKEDTNWDYEQQQTVTSTYTLSTIWYKEQRVLQFYTNDEANKGRRLSVYNVHRDACKDTGLLHHQSYILKYLINWCILPLLYMNKILQ